MELQVPTLRKLVFFLKNLFKFRYIIPANFEVIRLDNLSDGVDLNTLLDRFGSDKGSHHGYSQVYEKLLEKFRGSVHTVLEIGIGSNNPSIPSNMGINGQPGASLRAWREYFPNAQIIGADIDKQAHVNETRIASFYVDQMSTGSVRRLRASLPRSLSMLFIDGLHTLEADMNSAIELLPLIELNGFVFIEDTSKRTLPLWKLVGFVLSSYFVLETHQCNSSKTFLVSIKRIK